MKRIFSKKFWTVLISVPVVAGSIALACADGFWPEYGTSNFTPESFVDGAYKPFFYSEYFYYGIGHDTQHDERFTESNVNDWTAWFNNKSYDADIEYLLKYEDFATIDSVGKYFAGKLKQLPPNLKSSKLLATKNKKVEDFVLFLSYAKKAEEFALNHMDTWDWEPPKKARFNATSFNNYLLQEFNNTKDNFLKERYWFQLVRTYFFNSTPQSAVDAFEKNKAGFQKNKLYYRTMAYAAGGYYKLKNYSKANYYYSLVYDACDELKTVAHFSFHPQEEKDWKATLALCQNKDEQATLWQMLGVFYKDEKRAIDEIYKLNPKSNKLDLLLARAINKEEQDHAFPDWEKRGEPVVTPTVNKDLYALVNKIAAAGNTAKPHAWYMAAGYLSMIDIDFAKAQANFALAEKVLPKDRLSQLQLRLLKLINKLGATKTIDSKAENELLNDISWITNFKDEDENEVFRSTAAKEWVLGTMARRYRKQKDLVKSECFSSKPEFYGNNANIEALKAFLDKPNKTPYEELCAKLSDKKKGDLMEYQAVRLSYEDKLAEAITKMQEGANANRMLKGNPFNGRIQDCHDCDHEAPQKIKYTKLDLLKKMKEMEDKIAAGEDVYNNSMLLGNAFYNMSHFGNARYFYEGKIIASVSPVEDIDSLFLKVLTDMKLPKKYYNKALQAATTDEQKAKCQYMLAKCQRNEWYNATFYYPHAGYGGIDFEAWAGFKALKQYSNTQYYKDVIKECGYFRTYVNK